MRFSKSYFYLIGLLIVAQIFLFFGKTHILYSGYSDQLMSKVDFWASSTHANDKLHSEETKRVLKYPLVESNLKLKNPINISNINCELLFEGDNTEIVKAKTVMTQMESSYELEDIIKSASNCTNYHQQNGYIMDTLTEKEANFPIAYSIVMYKYVPQFEHMLRAIYRPQNQYCIHVDSKALDKVYQAVQAIVGCFPNVFLCPERVDVKWGEISVLTPEILCMEALYNKNKKWKYFINLTGQEFPLKTNAEIVDILTALNGANDIFGVYLSKWMNRFENASQIPHGLRPFKGKIHIVANRDYIRFLLHDQRSKDVLKWVAETKIPDETFFPTLNFNPSLKIPGSYKYDLPENYWTDNGKVSRFKEWHWCLPGTRVLRNICILGVEYLPVLKKSYALFANKFVWDFDRVSIQCLDDMLTKRTIDALKGGYSFNTTTYANMDFVKNKIV